MKQQHRPKDFRLQDAVRADIADFRRRHLEAHGQLKVELMEDVPCDADVLIARARAIEIDARAEEERVNIDKLDACTVDQLAKLREVGKGASVHETRR